MNGSYYKMTPTAYDTSSIVSTLGATPALPKSLYVYVELVNGAPILIFNKTFIPNTATLTYVGEIKTDGIRIIYSKFAKSSDFTGGNQDIAGTEGYQKLPGGLILQWGTTGNITGDITGTYTFPIAFPVACLNAVTSAIDAGDTWGNVNSFTTTAIKLSRGYSGFGVNGSGKMLWFAIGY